MTLLLIILAVFMVLSAVMVLGLCAMAGRTSPEREDRERWTLAA